MMIRLCFRGRSVSSLKVIEWSHEPEDAALATLPLDGPMTSPITAIINNQLFEILEKRIPENKDVDRQTDKLAL